MVAEKELYHLSAKIHDRMVKWLIFSQRQSLPCGVKKLIGREGYRIRVGNY
jgi:mRNA-degrading endonuclease RelE of RelBE toxin-antitoxin system